MNVNRPGERRVFYFLMRNPERETIAGESPSDSQTHVGMECETPAESIITNWFVFVDE